VLAGNQFMRMFTWFELGMVMYGIVRILGSFAATPIVPRDNPGNLTLIIFSFYVVMGTFRYLSYIGLRITWVDPEKPTQNQLNEPLLRVIEEKDRLLGGLIASNRMIGISALASSLAHQLSQPLTTIALRADTVLRDLAQSNADQKTIASLDEISSQSTKLADLVKNLRQLFGSRSSEFTSFNLQRVVDEIAEIVMPSLEAKKITLTRNYQSNPVVYGDSIQIQQVLINTLNNAIDALIESNIEQKEIVIGIANNENAATITIKDNGGGIDQDLLLTIFDLYKTTKKEGLGVGLWLSKTIMESHHGSISASNDPNGGAIFTIDIPMQHTLGK
jgi:C4-dicarboxylate-specific signal transduction histidine kinase